MVVAGRRARTGCLRVSVVDRGLYTRRETLSAMRQSVDGYNAIVCVLT